MKKFFHFKGLLGPTLIARLERQQKALLEIGRSWRKYEADVDQAIRAITETAAAALDMERTSVWELDPERKSITCRNLFEAAKGLHSSGTELSAEDFPAYFAALESEEVIAAHDAHNDPRTCEFSDTYLKPHGIGAMLDAPIRMGGRLVGVLCNEHVGGVRELFLDEQNTAAYLGSLVSLALEFQQRHMKELELARSLSLLQATFEATGEGVLALDEDGAVIHHNRRLVQIWGIPPGFLEEGGAALDHMSRQTRDPAGFRSMALEVSRSPNQEVPRTVELRDGRFVETICRPQWLDERGIGRVMSFRDVTHQKRVEEALRSSEERLRRQSMHDPLTGLFNRRHANERFEQEIVRTRRTGNPLSVAVIDIDHFKAVNDRYGHQVGDDILVALAADLSNRMRRTDLVCRWGGEEFLVLLPDTRQEGALKLMDGLRKYAGRIREGLPRITVSIGVAAFEDGHDQDSLFSVADRRLFEAKRLGRNRVAGGFEPDPVTPSPHGNPRQGLVSLPKPIGKRVKT